ncbi:hypothetical protein K488DRAFT_88140 [Vararia minispora EC-137]|uniref:Uncharacterized protein n=1 Tax=Vararia minispora EC-137 TaxID=1314806 RepID=A0ACB8QEH7_9AGAM|nr:hypothetical protein K488DRAFT_88140 [Vararia minispora EC-137]
MSSLPTSSNSTPVELNEALDTSIRFVIRRLVPIFMVESIAFGEKFYLEEAGHAQATAGFASTSLLLYSYVLARHHYTLSKIARQTVPSILAYGVFAAHWVLTLLYISDVLTGMPFAKLRSFHDTSTRFGLDFRTYFSPFVGEAVLLGALTALVIIVVALFLS